MMASGSSSRDDFEAALNAISRFNQLNAEAALVLGEQQTTEGEKRDVDVTTGSTGEENTKDGGFSTEAAGNANGLATSAEEVQRILGRKTDEVTSVEEGLLQNGHGETVTVTPGVSNGIGKEPVGIHDKIPTNGEGVKTGAKDSEQLTRTEFYDEEWSCTTDSKSQASDIVDASESVQDQVEDVETPAVAGGNTLHPYPASFKSVSPRSSSPLYQEEDKKKVVAFFEDKSDSGSDFPDSTDETSSFFSDTDTDADAAVIDEKRQGSHVENDKSLTENKGVHFESNTDTISQSSPVEENKELTDNLKALRDEFTEASLIKTGQQAGEDTKPFPPSAFHAESSEATEEESGNETTFIQDGHEVDPFAFFDKKLSEPVEEAKYPESPKPDIEKAEESDTKGQEAVWKAPVPLLRSNTFTKGKDANLVSEPVTQPDVQTKESDPVSPDKPAVWKAPHSLIPSASQEAILKSESEAANSEDPRAWTKSEKDGIWRAPVPIISPRPSKEDLDETPQEKESAKDESELERRGLWKAPYPIISRDSFPPISEKETAGEIAMKFEVQKVESNMSLSEKDPNYSAAPDECVPSMDELLARFERLRSVDDLMPNMPPGDAAEAGAISKEAEKDDLAHTKETDASSPKEDDKEFESDSTAEPTEKSDIFSTPNTKLYRGYIDIAGSDQEGSFTSKSDYSVHTKEEEESATKVGSLFEQNAAEIVDKVEGEVAVDHATLEDAMEKMVGGAAESGSEHDSDWMSEEENAGSGFFGSDSESDVNQLEKETDKETKVQDKQPFQDEPAPLENVEEPKTNISSDFKSSIDTSVWSASDEDFPEYDGKDAVTSEDGVERVPKAGPTDLDTQPEDGAAGSGPQSKDMSPQKPESVIRDLSELYHEKDAKTESADNSQGEKNVEDVPQADMAEDDIGSDNAMLDSSKPDTKQAKSGKSRRRGSVGKSSKQSPDEEGVGAPEVQQHRRRSRHKRDKIKKETTADVSLEVEQAEPTQDNRDAGSSATATEGKQTTKNVPARKPRRPSSGRPKQEEARVKFDEESIQDAESLNTDMTDVSSDRLSRRRHRKPRPPKISETLYHQRPITNEDMLDEKYIELLKIMRNDGIQAGELVKEVGVVLARAGLSPRSPREVPKPPPLVEKAKPKEEQEKFKPMPGVHVIPSDSDKLGPVAKPVPAERHSLRRHYTASSLERLHAADSFEKTQKQLYRKYNELNALLNRQLPEESTYLVQQQLEQTLALLQRHQKQGHFHSKPEGGEPAHSRRTSSQGQHDRPKSGKSVSFHEARPGSGQSSRSPRRSKHEKAIINAVRLLEQKDASDGSESESQSRSRSRSYSPTDCNLRSTKNPDVRSWLREKNRWLRKQKRAERLKELEEKRIEEEKEKEREEKLKVSSQRVQNWMRQKQKEARLLSKREEDSSHKIGKVPEKSADGFVKTTQLKEDAMQITGKSTPKRPVSAPGVLSVNNVPIVSKRKPLAATADNIVKSNKRRTGRFVDSETRDSSVGASNTGIKQNIDTCDSAGADSEQKKQRPKSSKRRKKKENKPVSEDEKAKTDLLKRRLSYDQWLQDKRMQDNKQKQKEKKLREKQLHESDHALDPLVPELARRRIRFIESSKKRVDSGVRRIDDEANSYPRGEDNVGDDLVNFSLNADPADVPTEKEERYQWRLEGEVSRPKSGKSSASLRRAAGSARPSSSPVSKTRARARLTMPKSDSSPRSRVENISEKGPNPFKSPIPVVNASLKRSGDARNRYAKHMWTNFSDDVWKQVNEEEGVGPFQVVDDSEGARNGVDKEGQETGGRDDASGASNGDAAPEVPNGEATSGLPNNDNTSLGATNGDAAPPEVPHREATSGLPNDDTSPGATNGDSVTQVGEAEPGSASGNIDGVSSEPAPSSSNVNFSGIFYTVDSDGVQHGLHEVPVRVKDTTHSDSDGLENGADAKDADTTPRDTNPRDPHKKKVNFGGIVYEVEKKDSPASSSDIEEEVDMVDGEDDEAPDGFFITSIDEA